MALRHKESPAPTSRTSAARSKILTSMPIRLRPIAAQSPPMPPPMMIAVGLIFTPLRLIAFRFGERNGKFCAPPAATELISRFIPPAFLQSGLFFDDFDRDAAFDDSLAAEARMQRDAVGHVDAVFFTLFHLGEVLFALFDDDVTGR